MPSFPHFGGHRRTTRLRFSQRALRIFALAVVLGVVALIVLLRDSLPDTEAIAYPGVFLLSMVSSAFVFIPIPGIVAVCTGGVLLMPLYVGLVAGVGEALGETTGYLAGYSGRGIAERDRRYRRIQPLMRRRGWLILLIFASIPNPLFDLVGVTAGAARIPLWQFYGAVWVGKSIKSTIVAYGCSHGYEFFRFFT